MPATQKPLQAENRLQTYSFSLSEQQEERFQKLRAESEQQMREQIEALDRSESLSEQDYAIRVNARD